MVYGQSAQVYRIPGIKTFVSIRLQKGFPKEYVGFWHLRIYGKSPELIRRVAGCSLSRRRSYGSARNRPRIPFFRKHEGKHRFFRIRKRSQSRSGYRFGSPAYVRTVHIPAVERYGQRHLFEKKRNGSMAFPAGERYQLEKACRGRILEFPEGRPSYGYRGESAVFRKAYEEGSGTFPFGFQNFKRFDLSVRVFEFVYGVCQTQDGFRHFRIGISDRGTHVRYPDFEISVHAGGMAAGMY